MSRHPTLPPITVTPEPAQLRETRRKRSAGSVWAKRTTADDLDDLGDSLRTAAPRPGDTATGTPVEAVSQRAPSVSGKLSDDTLKAMLELQEASGDQSGNGTAPAAKT